MKNWTVNAGEALQRAQNEAYRRGHAELEPLHLLWALLSETGLAAACCAAWRSTRSSCCAPSSRS